MNTRLLIGGLKSYLPVELSKYKGTGGTVTGAYCYSVWLRHLSRIRERVPAFDPSVLVELGPGDSIGLGLAALLTGAQTYIGLDVLEHASPDVNLRVLDELVALFRAHAPLPGDKEFPRLYPRLTSYAYPSGIVSDETLKRTLAPENVERIRAAVKTLSRSDGPVQYRCPWTAASVDAGSADLVISQVALQDMDHIPSRDALGDSFAAMARWLKPGGVMSHQIDFSCPAGHVWNHHWAFGDLTWTLIRGKRPYYVNRAPLSEYVSLCETHGFDVVGVDPIARDGLRRDESAPRFRALPEEDFHAAGALLIAVKR
ncbi:MAG: class I SAM-dependent methyltransferase [Gemmatimonadaceae bacterium]